MPGRESANSPTLTEFISLYLRFGQRSIMNSLSESLRQDMEMRTKGRF